MRKQDISVEALVDLVERGELRLPEIQRRYVWRAPRVRNPRVSERHQSSRVAYG